MNGYDPRTQELLDLARAENLRLPYPADYIIWLEDHGYSVDLITGELFVAVTVQPRPSGIAVAHLLSEAVGEIIL